MAIIKHLTSVYVEGMASAGGYSLTTMDIRVGLFTSALASNWPTLTLYDHIQPYECEDEGFSGGYMAYGRALQNKVVTAVAGQPFVVTTNPVIWESLTATFRYVIFWNGDNNLLIGGLDYQTDQVYTAQEFTIEMPSGLLTISVG